MLRHEDKNCLGGCKQARRTILAFSSTLMPPSPPASLGCRHNTLAQKRSASLSLKPISALGCNPKARGVSGGMASSMYSNTCSQGIKVWLGNSFLADSYGMQLSWRERGKVLSASAYQHVMICCSLYTTTPLTMQLEWKAGTLCCKVTPSTQSCQL